MTCALKQDLQKEHETMKEGYGEKDLFCPMLSRQICLWCCLHIHQIADPQKRAVASENFPGYERVASEMARKSWDQIWEQCSRCNGR